MSGKGIERGTESRLLVGLGLSWEWGITVSGREVSLSAAGNVSKFDFGVGYTTL